MFAIQTSNENTYFMPVVAHYLPHKIHLLRWCDMCISYTKPMIISASVFVCICAWKRVEYVNWDRRNRNWASNLSFHLEVLRSELSDFQSNCFCSTVWLVHWIAIDTFVFLGKNKFSPQTQPNIYFPLVLKKMCARYALTVIRWYVLYNFTHWIFVILV